VKEQGIELRHSPIQKDEHTVKKTSKEPILWRQFCTATKNEDPKVKEKTKENFFLRTGGGGERLPKNAPQPKLVLQGRERNYKVLSWKSAKTNYIFQKKAVPDQECKKRRRVTNEGWSTRA